MHYTYEDVQGRAEDLGDGWSRSVVTLTEGDTAISALSSKWDFAGPGSVEYLMHTSGWTVLGRGVTKRYS